MFNYFRTLVSVILTISILSAVSAMAQDPCAEGTPIAPSGVVRGVQWANAAQCYTMDLFRPGRLLLAVSTGGDARAAEPRLDVFQCRHGADGWSAVHVRGGWASSWLGEAELGRYAVCVDAQDSRTRLADFKLTSAFAARPQVKAGDPDEEEPEPEQTSACTKAGDPDEEEPEPEQTSACDKAGDPDEEEPEPEVPASLVGGESLCSSVAADDHADLYHCATPLVAGVALTGEIANDWGDDEDVFLLPLGKLTTVSVTVVGDDGINPALFDQFGHRLMVTEIKDTAGLNLTKTLAPGVYFVRLTSPNASKGTYRLEVALP